MVQFGEKMLPDFHERHSREIKMCRCPTYKANLSKCQAFSNISLFFRSYIPFQDQINLTTQFLLLLVQYKVVYMDNFARQLRCSYPIYKSPGL